LNVPLFTPPSLNPFRKDFKTISRELDRLNISLYIVADYGIHISNIFIKNHSSKMICLHPSLLPYLKGSSPILTSILKNYYYSGITVFNLSDQTDKGKVIYQQDCLTKNMVSYIYLKRKLNFITEKVLFFILPFIIKDKINSLLQNKNISTYSYLIQKKWVNLNLKKDAEYILNALKAFKVWSKISIPIYNSDIRIHVINIRKSSLFQKSNKIISNDILRVKKDSILISTNKHFLEISSFQYKMK
jgi:methionyl-tRNA formyltransferase